MESETLSTILHYYSFDLNDTNQAYAYEALVLKLTGMGLKKFSGLGDPHETWKFYEKIKKLDGQPVLLETKHIFENQWNTAPIEDISEDGLRVFDWAEPYQIENKKYRYGHWLEQTHDMQWIRDNTLKCGYCGHAVKAQTGLVFCDQCIDSQYLQRDQLHLLRMKAVSDPSVRLELSEAEKEHLYPLYEEGKIKGVTELGKARLEKQRQDVYKRYDRTINEAKMKRKAHIWCLDNGFDIFNCIYYQTQDGFTFGWHTPLTKDEVDRLLKVISEFPFPYKIKCKDPYPDELGSKELEGH